MSTAAAYDFGWPQVTEFGTFTVDFSTASSIEVPKHGKNGDYTQKEWSVVIRCAKISEPILLTGIRTKDYERMRVLYAMRLKNLTVTRGMAAPGQPASFAPYIISGAA